MTVYNIEKMRELAVDLAVGGSGVQISCVGSVLSKQRFVLPGSDPSGVGDSVGLALVEQRGLWGDELARLSDAINGFADAYEASDGQYAGTLIGVGPVSELGRA